MIQTSHRKDIDALRGLAITLGILYHLDLKFVSGGFVALDIFLVLSGFLITSQIIKKLEDQGDFSFSQFYANRVRRLFPALFVFVLICTLLFTFFCLGNPKTTDHFLSQVRYALFACINIFFNNNTRGYFDLSSDKMPLLNVWSLSLEEQFYLFWPLILFLLYHTSSQIVRWSYRSRVRLFIVIMSLISFIATIWAQKNGMISSTFYLVHFRAWEFGSGALLSTFNLNHLRAKRKISLSTLVAFGGLTSILLAVYFFKNTIVFPGYTALPSVVGTVMLLISGDLEQSNIVSRSLANKFLVHVGEISYSMFLWHWALLSLATLYFVDRPSDWLIKLSILAVSIVIAELSYFLIEHPFRKKIYFKNASNRQVILSGLALSTILATSTLLVKKQEEKIIARNPKFYFFVHERTKFIHSCFDKVANVGSSKCKERSGQSDNTKAIPRVMFFGDSHAYSRYAMLESLQRKKNIESSIYAFSSMAPLFGEFREDFKKQQMQVETVRDEIIKQSADKSSLFSMVITCNWTQIFPDKIFLMSSDSNECHWNAKLNRANCMKIFANYLDHTLSDLSRIGVHKIILVEPPVEFRYDVIDCFKRFGYECATSLQDFNKSTADIVANMKEVVKKYPNVRLISLNHCDKDHCPQVIRHNNEDVPVVFDTNHPTSEISRIDGEEHLEDLEWLIQ